MVVFDDNSYVKLFRKFEKWEWYLDIYTTKLFIHCLIKANWEDKKWKGILIKRGSFVTSLSNLARESGLSVRNVRTSLKRLESTQEVTRLSTAKYTIITVLNYDRYQSTDKVSDKQVTNKRQTSDKQVTTTKEYKEYKEYKEDEEYIYIDHFDYKAKFNEFWSEYPKKIAKQKCLDKFKKICTTDETFSAIMTGLRKYNELQYQFTDTQFIPNPLTWLNQERWLDEIHDKRPKNLKQKNNTTFYHEVEPPSYFREQKDLNIENITENDIKSRINNLKIPPVERGM